MQDISKENDKTETENEDIEEIEKNIDLICETFSETIKLLKIFLHFSDKDKKKVENPKMTLGQSLIDVSKDFSEDNILLYSLQKTGQSIVKLSEESLHFEARLEKEIIPSFEKIIESDIEEIDKAKKNFLKSKVELDGWKSKNLISQKHNLPKEKVQNMEIELNLLIRKYENAQDIFFTELFKFISKEKNYSWLYIKMLEIEIEYHKKSSSIISEILPSIYKNIDSSPSQPLFGISFEKHFSLFGEEISIVLKDCSDLIIKNGLDMEGIFRMAGSNAKIKKIRASFDAGFSNQQDKNFDIYSLAVVMKQYLRELPEPILTFELEDKWIELLNYDISSRLDIIIRLAKELPRLNYVNLKFLMGFLVKVSNNSEINKMNPSNLAIVIGPNLLWSKDESKYLKCASVGTVVVDFMVTNFNEVFDVYDKTNASKRHKPIGSQQKSFELDISRPIIPKKNKHPDLAPTFQEKPPLPISPKIFHITEE